MALYDYLGKQIAGSLEEGDEFEQRMESDEAAVKILTVHKAKGLQYPIVIAPFLDLTNYESYDICSYREPGADGEYKFYCKPFRSEEQKKMFKDQLDQENCRLLYVALTRAKYNCFLFKTSGEKVRTTCLSPYATNFDNLPSLDQPIPEKEGEKKSEGTPLPPFWGEGEVLTEFDLPDQHHGKLSFSVPSAPTGLM